MKTKEHRAAMVLTTALVLSAALTPSAQAQQLYRCTNAAGVQHWSDRPCAPSERPFIGSRGTPNDPGADRRRRPIYVPTPPGVPEHTKYLSPACAQISEAIRTAPSRGVRGLELNQLHTEYQRKCRDEEPTAYQRMHEDQRAEQEEKYAAQREKQQQQEEAKLSQEQCGEMKRILFGRRQRVASMNEGEKADLQRFEANFKARCATAAP